MGTITVKIKKNPLLCDIITDSGTLYYEYEQADIGSMTVSIAAKSAADIIIFEKSCLTKRVCDPDVTSESEKKDVSVSAPENSRFHVCFVDGDGRDIDVLVSRPVFIEHLKFILEDEKQRGEYRRHEDLFVDLSLSEKVSMIIGDSLEEMMIRKDIIARINEAFSALTPLQSKHLEMYFVRNMKLREVAEEENTSVSNVGFSIRRAVRILKELLESI